MYATRALLQKDALRPHHYYYYYYYYPKMCMFCIVILVFFLTVYVFRSKKVNVLNLC